MALFEDRPLDLGPISSAFAQLGQSNALVAQRQEQERRRKQARKENRMGQALGLVGGVVGGVYGGPAGAAAGYGLGSALGRGAAGGQVDTGQVVSSGFNMAAIQQQQAQTEQDTANRQELSSALNPPPNVDETGYEQPGQINPARVTSALGNIRGQEGTAASLALKGQGGTGNRRIVKGADGYNYYSDTQERVLPRVEMKQSGVDTEKETTDDFILAPGDSYTNSLGDEVVTTVPLRGKMTFKGNERVRFVPDDVKSGGGSGRGGAGGSQSERDIQFLVDQMVARNPNIDPNVARESILRQKYARPINTPQGNIPGVNIANIESQLSGAAPPVAQPTQQPSEQPPPQTEPLQKPALIPNEFRARRPLPPSVLDDLEQGITALDQLTTLRETVGETGIFKGAFNKYANIIGLGSAESKEFEAARANMKLAAQALIKGIPSNFDVQTVINTLPDITLPKSVNETRLNNTEKVLRRVLKAKISYYKGLGYEVPEVFINTALELGVNAERVQAMDATRAQSISEGKGVALDKDEIFKGIESEEKFKSSTGKTFYIQ